MSGFPQLRVVLDLLVMFVLTEEATGADGGYTSSDDLGTYLFAAA